MAEKTAASGAAKLNDLQLASVCSQISMMLGGGMLLEEGFRAIAHGSEISSDTASAEALAVASDGEKPDGKNNLAVDGENPEGWKNPAADGENPESRKKTAQDVKKSGGWKASALETAADAVADRLEEGNSLCEACRKSGAFPEYFLRVIAVSEKSGQIEGTAQRLRFHYETSDAIRRRIRAAMFYPCGICIGCAAVLFAAAALIFPAMSGALASLAASFGVGDSFLRSVGAGQAVTCVCASVCALAGLAFGVVGLISALPQSDFVNRAPRGLPVIGRLLDTSDRAEFCSELSMLMSGGDDAETALRELCESGSPRVRALAQRSLTRSAEGEAEALLASGCFSGTDVSLIRTAARSGRLASTLADMGEQFEEFTAEAADGVVEAIEPLASAFISVSIGIGILTLVAPGASLLAAM